jgi:acetolactate synthase-1/2/3 large subunit
MSKEIRGAEALIKSLVAEGVHTIFGYPGGAIMPIYDALYDYKEEINHILVRHEQGAIHAAQGFARTSETCGVCFATSGPGATNLITGLADAMIDSTPVVCITGQVASHLLGTDAFQETDVIGISMPVTKWNTQVKRAEDIPAALAKAFFIARSGRPGPVLVDITKDAQFGMMDFNYKPCNDIRSYFPNPVINVSKIDDAIKLINESKKPYLLVGQGITLSNAEQELLDFAEKSGIPVASTLLGLGAFPPDHPLYVGYLGMHGNYAPNIKTNDCDVLIAVGMRFDDRVTGDVSRYAKQAKIIHIDIDFAELNKIVTNEVSIHADAKEALTLLTSKVENRSHDAWIQEFRDAEKLEVEAVIEDAIHPKHDRLQMAEVFNMLSEKTDGKAIVVTDVGQHQMVTSRYYQYKAQNTNITSGGLGTMGFALPAAIGAKLGNPSKTVVAIIGDGGFQMTIQELGTILQFKIDIKILILNNNFLGMVRQWQEMFFEKRYSFTDIVNPNFIQIAKGYDIEAKSIDQRTELSEALDTMLSSKAAYLLEAVVEQEENVFPMVATGASVSEIRLN